MSALADILNKAADLIEANGLHKEQYAPRWDAWRLVDGSDAGADIRAGSPCCALGAIYTAAGGRPGGVEAEEAFAEYLADHITESGIPDWNDAPERTQQEVVTALRETAEANR